MPIGVFDSGLGGLTVLRALRRAMPNQGFVYYADSAHAPYGARTPAEVRGLTQAAVDRLFALECRLVLLACNTASALALRPIQQEWLPHAAPENRALGVFVPIVEALTGRPWGAGGPPTPAPAGRRQVLFFATPATVASGAFEREVATRTTGLSVISEPCPGLVAALEVDDADAAVREVRSAVAAALARVEGAAPEAAILGCTHYPLAKAAFRAALPPETAILSQPDIVAASLARYLARHPQFEGADGAVRCLTSGDPETFGPLAARFFGEPLTFERDAATRGAERIAD